MDRLRLVSLNFWGLSEPLERRLRLAEAQLAALAPDVVALQEVRPLQGADGETTAHVLAQVLGLHCVYAAAWQWRQGERDAGEPAGAEGLAVLSRYPILEHRVTRLPHARPFETRILLSVRLDVGDGLWCHVTHLHWRLDDGLAREAQVVAIDEVLASLATRGTPQLLCGDFNAIPDADEIRFLRGLTTLAHRRTHYQDAWQRVHGDAPGYTWSASNPATLGRRSVDPDRRIDYIFVTTREKNGVGKVLDCQVVLQEQDEGICASDHFGLLAEVQRSDTP